MEIIIENKKITEKAIVNKIGISDSKRAIVGQAIIDLGGKLNPNDNTLYGDTIS